MTAKHPSKPHDGAILVLITSDKSDEDLSRQAAELGWLAIFVACPTEALHAVLKQKPCASVVALDRRGAESACRIIVALRQRRPELPVLAIDASPSAAVEIKLRAAGVNGYLGGSLRKSASALASLLARRLQETPPVSPGRLDAGLHRGRAPPPPDRSPPY